MGSGDYPDKLYFNQSSEPTTMTDILLPLLLCVYSRMRRSHERPSLVALLFLVARSAPASTES